MNAPDEARAARLAAVTSQSSHVWRTMCITRLSCRAPRWPASIKAHAVRIAGTTKPSSFDHMANIANSAAAPRRRRAQAYAAATAQNVTISAVRPLIQSTAMLMP